MNCKFCKQDISSSKRGGDKFTYSEFKCIDCDTFFFTHWEDDKRLISYYIYIKYNESWYSWDYFLERKIGQLLNHQISPTFQDAFKEDFEALKANSKWTLNYINSSKEYILTTIRTLENDYITPSNFKNKISNLLLLL